MLTKAYKVLYEQLTKNLAEQDFYKDVCTEIYIKNEVVLQLQHPSLVLDLLTGDTVFPEFIQNDIDKEYEPMIALSFSFNMKNEKMQLEKFKSRADFRDFKEIKDFGTRMYAMTFGTDVEKAAEKCIDIIKEIYEGEKVKSLQIITQDLENGEIYHKKTITSPKKDIEPTKVAGIAIRVVEDKPTPISTGIAAPTASSMASISEKSYKRAQWLLGIIVAFCVIIIVFISTGKDRRDEDVHTKVMNYVDSIVPKTVNTPISGKTENTIIQNTQQITKEDKVEENKKEIIGNWKETSAGYSSPYVWQLERDNTNKQYFLSQFVQGELFQKLKCTYKKIKRKNEYTFRHDDRTFALNVGEEIYYISNFDNEANAILIINNSSAFLYVNDIDSRIYDYFATLQTIN